MCHSLSMNILCGCVAMQGGGVEKLAAEDPRLDGLRVVPCATLLDALREVRCGGVRCGGVRCGDVPYTYPHTIRC